MFALACPDMWVQTPAEKQQLPAQWRLRMSWGGAQGWSKSSGFPAWLHNTFPAPESWPRAPAHPGPGEGQQEADWKSR